MADGLDLDAMERDAQSLIDRGLLLGTAAGKPVLALIARIRELEAERDSWESTARRVNVESATYRAEVLRLQDALLMVLRLQDALLGKNEEVVKAMRRLLMSDRYAVPGGGGRIAAVDLCVRMLRAAAEALGIEEPTP